jgi:ketosteroid isomerase-like protein
MVVLGLPGSSSKRRLAGRGTRRRPAGSPGSGVGRPHLRYDLAESDRGFAPLRSNVAVERRGHMIDSKWAREFAHEWIDSWNAHDLNRILSHYADDFEMRSPIIVERMGIASGVLKGKKAVSPYWAPALAASTSPPLKFVLHDVLVGTDAVALYYYNVTRGKMVVEVLTFNDQRQVVTGSAHYAESRA